MGFGYGFSTNNNAIVDSTRSNIIFASESTPPSSFNSLIDMKIVLLGKSGVGKSSLLRRFVKEDFSEILTSTIGAMFNLKVWKDYKLGIWDTAGQEKYSQLSSFYCRGTEAAILVFDVNNKMALREIEKYYNLLRNVEPYCHCLLVGTKCDLYSEEQMEEYRNLSLRGPRQRRLYSRHSFPGLLSNSSCTLPDPPTTNSFVSISSLHDSLDRRPRSPTNDTAFEFVSPAEAFALADRLGLDFYLTSAITGYNVESIFDNIVIDCLEKRTCRSSSVCTPGTPGTHDNALNPDPKGGLRNRAQSIVSSLSADTAIASRCWCCC